MDQIKREINDVLFPELLMAYHGERHESHLFTRHMDVSLKELKNRLRRFQVGQDDIVKSSRFLTNDLSEIAKQLHTCLEQNYAKIEDWHKSRRMGKLEISCVFPSPIGECIVKNTDWNETFQESVLVVILVESDIPGRLFRILTAYPDATLDEIDVIYDAIDLFQANRH